MFNWNLILEFQFFGIPENVWIFKSFISTPVLFLDPGFQKPAWAILKARTNLMVNLLHKADLVELVERKINGFPTILENKGR